MNKFKHVIRSVGPVNVNAGYDTTSWGVLLVAERWGSAWKVCAQIGPFFLEVW